MADIRRVADLAGTNVISFRLYRKSGDYDPTTAALGSVPGMEPLVAAGLEIACERNITDERLFENLMRFREHYGRQPRFRELACPPSVISSGPCQRRFQSRMNALEQFVAYANAQDADSNPRRNREWSSD